MALVGIVHADRVKQRLYRAEMMNEHARAWSNRNERRLRFALEGRAHPVLSGVYVLLLPGGPSPDRLGRARLDRLLSDDNAFALVTAAHLLTQQTRRQHVKRYTAKRRLVRLLYERNWEKQRVIDLFGVIDWMMQIPPEMQMQLMNNIEEFEGKLNKPNMNSFDRRNELERARQEGREEGRHDLCKLLAALLEKRFGRLPQHVRDRLEQADKHELRRWGESMLDATSLDRVFSDR